ncbi:hypothetical protein CANINC_004713 [Pichia inconspicua]|uniref:Rho-GAP domain-containing protein n=1 Tax=Pichia inconspicua TaxID=52247 RepID=A0A4T0WW12_9ASCO|nr:hypothetical protein CANINC_004713 [[Candida] inconspicua]
MSASAVSVSVYPNPKAPDVHLQNAHSAHTPKTTTSITTSKIRCKDPKITDTESVKSKQSRRRSISAFTFHSNTSFDQQKRRSFSNTRNSISVSTTPGSNVTMMNPLYGIEKRRSLSNNKPKGTSGTRFFSSPQFSSSTPNLSPKQTKYLDNELKLSHCSVSIENIVLIIPTIIQKCCNYILSNPHVEGLFRMNGSIKQIKIIELELSKNLESYDFTSDPSTSVHDVAVVLKRWISKLDDGLLTPMVIDTLTMNQRRLFDEELFSDLDDNDEKTDEAFSELTSNNNNENISNTPNLLLADFNALESITKTDSLVENNDLGDVNIDNSIVDMTNSIDLINSPLKTDSINTPERHRPYLYDYNSPYSSSLIKLPIENLHLVLFILHFLNTLSQPQISNITKMHSNNLAKVFQLNFFKSVDLTFGTKSFSTEDLKSSYSNNEQLLTNLIDNIPIILKDVSNFISNEKCQMESILNNTTATSTFMQNTFSNYILSKKKNSSNSSIALSDNLPKSVSRTKDLNQVLEPCVEGGSAPSTAVINQTEIIDGTIHNIDTPGETVPHSENTSRKDSVSSTKRHTKRKSVFNFFNRKSSIASDSIASYNSEQTTVDSVDLPNSDNIHQPLKSLNTIIDIPSPIPTEDLSNQQQQQQSNNGSKLTSKRFSFFKFKK